jgi:hypothetical protein
MRATFSAAWVIGLCSLLMVACGGGGGSDAAAVPDVKPATGSPAPTAPPSAPAPPAADGGAQPERQPPAADPPPDLGARTAAVLATVADTGNACGAIRPFYWEIGDHGGRMLGGSAGTTPAGARIRDTTTMRYASATKWLYAAYVAQRRGGVLAPWDARMLSMRAGYVDFAGCLASQTVDACLAWQDNDRQRPEADGAFFYGGGHMQKHASLIGLGHLDADGLAAAWRAVLGEDLAIGMLQARPGGGAVGTPATYAAFLRKLLGGELALGAMLGDDPACASVERCAAGEALYSPAPARETWHYSYGHWVEDDRVAGDGAFSSAGAFGFYPWIDAARTQYGIVAREVANASGEDEGIGAGEASARCGRLIRLAWASGVAQ